MVFGSGLFAQNERTFVLCENMSLEECLTEETTLVLEDGLFELSCIDLRGDDRKYKLDLSITIDARGFISIREYQSSITESCAMSLSKMLEKYYLGRTIKKEPDWKPLEIRLKYEYEDGEFRVKETRENKIRRDAFFGNCKTDKCSSREFSRYTKEQVSYLTKKSVAASAMKTVSLGFRINEDGSVSDVRVLNGVSDELDEIALKVIKEMPSWQPAYEDGEPVSALKLEKVSFLGRVPY